MKKTHLTLSLLGAVLSLAAISSASAALVVHYSFNGNSLGALTGGETIDNVAGAIEGTFTAGTAGGSASIVSYSGGKALKLTPATDGAETTAAPHVATGFTATAAGSQPGRDGLCSHPGSGARPGAADVGFGRARPAADRATACLDSSGRHRCAAAGV